MTDTLAEVVAAAWRTVNDTAAWLARRAAAEALTAEVDRIAPGWRIELGDAYVRIPPLLCPRCGELCVFIEWPPRRQMMPAWREVNVETLAQRLGPGGVGEVTALRHHDVYRCGQLRAAALVDLDAQ